MNDYMSIQFTALWQYLLVSYAPDCFMIVKALNLMHFLRCLCVQVFKTLPRHVAPVCGSVHSGKSPGGRVDVWTWDPKQLWQMQHWWGVAPGRISPKDDNRSAHFFLTSRMSLMRHQNLDDGIALVSRRIYATRITLFQLSEHKIMLHQ